MKISKEGLKELVKLKQKKFRQEKNMVIVEGKRIIKQLLQNKIPIQELYITESEDRDYWKNFGIPLLNLKEFEMEKIASTKNPQSIMALVKTEPKQISKNNLLLYLDRINEPGNLGTIFRTASAFGIDGIVLSQESCEVFNPKVVRSSLGAVFQIPVEIHDADWLKNQSHYKIATSMENAIPLQKINNNPDKKILIMGSEAFGIRQEILELANVNVKIPISDHMESLNVAVATGIILHHFAGNT